MLQIICREQKIVQCLKALSMTNAHVISQTDMLSPAPDWHWLKDEFNRRDLILLHLPDFRWICLPVCFGYLTCRSFIVCCCTVSLLVSTCLSSAITSSLPPFYPSINFTRTLLLPLSSMQTISDFFFVWNLSLSWKKKCFLREILPNIWFHIEAFACFIPLIMIAGIFAANWSTCKFLSFQTWHIYTPCAQPPGQWGKCIVVKSHEWQRWFILTKMLKNETESLHVFLGKKGMNGAAPAGGRGSLGNELISKPTVSNSGAGDNANASREASNESSAGWDCIKKKISMCVLPCGLWGLIDLV